MADFRAITNLHFVLNQAHTKLLLWQQPSRDLVRNSNDIGWADYFQNGFHVRIAKVTGLGKRRSHLLLNGAREPDRSHAMTLRSGYSDHSCGYHQTNDDNTASHNSNKTQLRRKQLRSTPAANARSLAGMLVVEWAGRSFVGW